MREQKTKRQITKPVRPFFAPSQTKNTDRLFYYPHTQKTMSEENEKIEADEFNLSSAFYIIVLHTNDSFNIVEMFNEKTDLFHVCKALKYISKESAGDFVLYDDPVFTNGGSEWVNYRSCLLCRNGKSKIYDDELNMNFEHLQEDYERLH